MKILAIAALLSFGLATAVAAACPGHEQTASTGSVVAQNGHTIAPGNRNRAHASHRTMVSSLSRA